MPPITRFAPSPTGMLHIGSARTALFNWLYSKHTGGTFLLRIEDTDAERSTPEAVEAIYEGLRWLGLDWDGDPILQSKRAARHREVAEQMLAAGNAYHCYCSPEELEAMRAEQKAKGVPMRYDGRWRDRDPKDAPSGVKPVIRLKAPREGETIIRDRVQGDVRIAAEQLDDMVLLRADGSPTYMLAVVVDDHDMEITHVIRGVDHLNNAARQMQIYRAMGWEVPSFSHIPLIHGPDGAKLSKRHGALGVAEYERMGYRPEAMRNYLARLGWSHGDDEIFSTEQAIEWFDLDGIGRSAARFDYDKLRSLNAHYIQQAAAEDPAGLIAEVVERIQRLPEVDPANSPPAHALAQHADAGGRLRTLLPELAKRAKDMNELAINALPYVVSGALSPDAKASGLLTPDARAMLGRLAQALDRSPDWSPEALDAAIRSFAALESRKLGDVAQPVRAALTGRAVSPGVFEIMAALGRSESLARLRKQAA
ncbi:MAG: glutamate--tRNA ligase [Alphaproteobacteria bacterium]|nr:glutamate--tRNA ligase [Alphaproteobacteria bacterium]